MNENLFTTALIAVVTVLSPRLDTIQYYSQTWPNMNFEKARKADSAFIYKNAYKIGYSYSDVERCLFYRHCQIVKLLKEKK